MCIRDRFGGVLKKDPVPVQASPDDVSAFEFGKYKVESEHFDDMSKREVNLWPSFSDRSKVVGVVKEHTVVEVVDYDYPDGYYEYCKITAGEKTGWLACEWLVKEE